MPKPRRIECDCGSSNDLKRIPSGIACRECRDKQFTQENRNDAKRDIKSHLTIYDFGICHLKIND